MNFVNIPLVSLPVLTLSQGTPWIEATDELFGGAKSSNDRCIPQPQPPLPTTSSHQNTTFCFCPDLEHGITGLGNLGSFHLFGLKSLSPLPLIINQIFMLWRPSLDLVVVVCMDMNAKYSLIKSTSHQLCSHSVASRAEHNPMNYAHHPILPTLCTA